MSRQLILVAILIFLIIGILATYNGTAHLLRWGFWKTNYNDVYTDVEPWTEESVKEHLYLGLYFIITGALGILGALVLFFKGLPAVMQENKPMLRRLTLPFGLIGLSPSPGLFIGGFFLLLVYMMFVNERFDLFGLILEDVARARRRAPMPAAAGSYDSRQAYATAYEEQKGLYTDDYSSAAYGGGAEAYGDMGGVDASAPSLVDELAAPICPNCGKATEWIEEYQRYYCYDDDRYV